jgi:hypothetical protein
MEKKLPELASVTRLIKKADLYLGPSSGPTTHRSLPVPIHGPTGLRVAFMYAPGGKTEGSPGLLLYAPNYLAFFDVEVGEFEELKAVDPGELGTNLPSGQPIGTHSPGSSSADELASKQALLYRDYDVLMGSFGAGLTSVSQDVRDAAREYMELFHKLAEPPLFPYYQFLGRQFFGWLSQIAA